MKRLLEDATALSGVKYNIESYADVVDALHVIQTEMGITGTTAKEASSTISGSFASLQSSAKNLLTAFASDEIPIDEVISQTLDSLVTYGDNVIPRIEQIFHNVKWVIEDYVDDVGTLIGNLSLNIAQKAPKVIEAGFNLIDTMTSGLTKNSGAVRAAGESIIGSLAEGISGAVANLEPAAGDIIGGLASGFITYKGLTLDVGVQVLGYIVDGIHENLGMIERESKAVLDKFVAQVTNPERLEELSGKGADILIALGNGISYASSQLYGAALDVVIAFGKGLVEKNAVYELTTAAGEVLTNFIGGFTPERLDQIFNIGGQALDQFLDGISGGTETEGALSKIVISAAKLVTNLGNKIVENAPEMEKKAETLINDFIAWFDDPENLNILDDAAAAIVNGVFALSKMTMGTVETFVTGALNWMYDFFTNENAENEIGGAGAYLGDIFKSEFVKAAVVNVLELIETPVIKAGEAVSSMLSVPEKIADWIGGEGTGREITDRLGFNLGTVEEILDEHKYNEYLEDVEAARQAADERRMQTVKEYTETNAGFPTSGKTVNVTQNIYAQAQTPSELMQEAMYRAEEAVIFRP